MAQNKRPISPWAPISRVFRSLMGKPNIGNPNRADYLQDLTFQHRTFDVKGIAAPGEANLDLKHVFVNVGLSRALQNPSANPIPALRRSSREKQFNIWQFLLYKANNRPKNLVVLGAPGTGKTTLLKHLALSLADPSQDPPHLDKTPVLLYLRDIANSIGKNPHYGLPQAVQAMLTKRKVMVSLDWLTTELTNGRCLIMLDGLDEVADLELRQQAAAWVQRQMRAHSLNQFVITSRPFGYQSNPLPNTLELEVKPFTIEQIRQFVNNWYLANEQQKQRRNDDGVRRDAAINASDLLQRLNQTPALLEMGVNPLLLTMIATIHHYRGRLPDHRVALYNEICDVFLGRRQQARGLEDDLTPSQKKRVLQTLAYEMMRRSLRNISQADAADIIDPALQRVHPQTASDGFLQMIANNSGLLIEHTAGVYSFAHLTFQEYLTAVHIKDQQLEQVLLDHVEESWWHETIRLYSAQANATNIIRACVMRETASIPALTLAVECLDEALEVEDDFRKIPQELVRSIEDENPEISRIGAEVLLQLRLRQLVRLDETTYVDNTLVTQAEYQLFLNEMRSRGSYRQPDHWSDLQFEPGEGQKPIVGVRPSDALAFCDWLTERETGGWRFRLPTAKEQARPPLNTPSSDDESIASHWFLNSGSPKLAHSTNLTNDVALIQALQQQIKNRLHNDQLIITEFDEDEAATHLRRLILKQAKKRAYTLRDLEQRLPLSKEVSAKIGRFYGRIQDRNAEGFATDMERLLIAANAYVQNPNLAYAQRPILEEIVEMGNHLLTSLNEVPFPQKITKLMHQLMRDLGRAREHLSTVRQSMKSEFQSHRELVRHLNNARGTAQDLLDALSRNRTNARIRLRIIALRRSLELLRFYSNPTTKKQQDQRLLTVLVDLYVDMAILESRTNKKMVSLEGIRLIREATHTGK